MIFDLFIFACRGSIPALAGERLLFASFRLVKGVYPRACGGTSAYPLTRGTDEGLSPRLRGNEIMEPPIMNQKGSIPALAGERRLGFFNARDLGVYPRACGGTTAAVTGFNRSKGLSPRLRGNGFVCDSFRRYCGSIPALAGERFRTGLVLMLFRVYPRACGGTGDYSKTGLETEGLSPRLRGNVFWQCLLTFANGSIPALAGER